MKKTKNKNIKLVIILFVLILSAVVLVIVLCLNALEVRARETIEAERLQIWQTAELACEEIFQDGVVKEDTQGNELTSCENKLDLVYDQADTKVFRGYIESARRYYDFENEIGKLYDENGIFREDVKQSEVLEIEQSFVALKKSYQHRVEHDLDAILSEYNNLKITKSRVKALFKELEDVSNYEQAEVADGVDRNQYNEAKTIVEGLSQQGLRGKLLAALEKVEQKVSEDERIAREKLEAERLERERIRREQEEAERRRQEEINAAWHIMNMPYISQNHNGVPNGCEAAALLMSLKYKGFLANKGYREFVDEMPKTNNPHTGFYLDVYSYEPRTEAHWIDTAPLAEYGRKSSGSSAVYNLKDLEDIIGGVPKNLHVMVLSGYNHLTNEYQVTDSYTRKNGQYIFTVPGSTIENLYNLVGRRAVVVRAE